MNGLWVLLVYSGPDTSRARLKVVVLNPEVDSSSEACIRRARHCAARTICYSTSCCTICTRTGWTARLVSSELQKLQIPERGFIAAHHCIRQLGKRRLWSETAIPDPIDREDATPPNEPSYYLPFIKRDLQPWADLGGITKVGHTSPGQSGTCMDGSCCPQCWWAARCSSDS